MLGEECEAPDGGEEKRNAAVGILQNVKEALADGGQHLSAGK